MLVEAALVQASPPAQSPAGATALPRVSIVPRVRVAVPGDKLTGLAA